MYVAKEGLSPQTIQSANATKKTLSLCGSAMKLEEGAARS